MMKFGTDDVHERGTEVNNRTRTQTKGNPDTSEKRWLLRGVRFMEFLRHWRYAFDVVATGVRGAAMSRGLCCELVGSDLFMTR